MSAEPQHELHRRLPTGIPGLDLVLRGGLPAGGIFMLMGRPGAGKTILGNQIAFHHAASGGRALYVTLLTESHSRLLASLQQLAFYDPTVVGDAVTYMSGYQAYESERLPGLLSLLRKAVREQKASLLVVDGLVTEAGTSATADLEIKKFLHKLQVLVELMGCTTLVLTGARDADSNYAQRTMVDGLLTLSARRAGMRTVRELEVLKLRGSDAVQGSHFFDITAKGITLHPRTEAVLGVAAGSGQPRTPVRFGVGRLDEMLRAGLLSGSSTLLLGSPGSGKTVLGLSFLAEGARLGEPGLYFGFFEPPDRVVAKADAVGLGFSEHIEADRIAVRWRAPLDLTADAVVGELLAEVRRRKVRRLFIDGLAGLRESLIYPERSTTFFTALTNELRSLGVTTIASEETNDLIGTMGRLPEENLSATVENIVCLRYVEMRSQLRRLVSILKMREGGYDSSLREFSISDAGVDVSASFASAEAILSGQTHPHQQSAKTARAKSPAKKASAKNSPAKPRSAKKAPPKPAASTKSGRSRPKDPVVAPRPRGRKA